jgi:hypothetical protein
MDPMTKNVDITDRIATVTPAPGTHIPKDLHGQTVTIVDHGTSYFPIIRKVDGTTGRIHRGNLTVRLA